MLRELEIRRLLAPFEVEMTSAQIRQLLTYVELLMKWNRTVNLTAVRSVEECVTRHFGESLYVARWLEPRGTLLDVGSGAGFPGLALKVAFPELKTTLLEPSAKKRAFLKEAARACGFESVDVRGERLEGLVRDGSLSLFSTVTSRAVGHLDRLVPLAARCLEPRGRLILWLSHKQGMLLRSTQGEIVWGPPIALPLAHEREIRIGTHGLSS